MNRLLAALVFALAFVSCAVSAQALNVTPIDGIVAVVDEDVILRSELQRAVSNILNQYADTPQQLPPRDVLEKQVLERLIVLRLQVQRAQGSGIRIADGEVDQTIRSIAQQNNIDVDQLRAQLAADGLPYEEFRQTLRDELTAQRLRQNISQSRVSVSDTEIDLLLANNQFSQGQVNASLLLVALPENATQEQIETAQRKVEGIHDLIVRGEMDFKAAAIRYSDAPNALDGGDLGWRSYDEVPSMFTDLIQGMAVGEMTPPMRGPTGFHLIRVNDKRDDSRQTLTEYHLRGILVRVTEVVSREQAQAKINRIRERLQAGEDFASIAKQESDDTMTRNQGGDMGWYPSGAWGAAVERVTLALEDGELSEPFSSEVGFHLIQRLGKREQDITEESLRNRARDAIARRKAEEEFERFVRQLRDEAYVENRLTNT